MKLILFDCDGTLADSQHMIVAAMRKAYAAHGLVCPPREHVLSIVGLSLAEAFHTLAGGAPHPVADLVESYKRAFQELRRADDSLEPLFPGAREAVETLARDPDILLGIVTGKSQRGVRAVLGRHGLYEHFAVIKTADDAPSKPNPAMAYDAMHETGIAACDTIVVGDTVFDMDMAHAAGVGAIGVAWGYHTPQALTGAGAFRVIAHFGELPEALAAVWALRRAGADAAAALPPT